MQTTTISLTNRYTFLCRVKEKDIRYSLIRDIKTSINENTYTIINKIINVSFPKPHPHITLYKQADNDGIGVNSEDDYDLYKVIATNDINVFLYNI